MELRVLKYFLTVAQEESFSRAAEKLHLSQPTLSRQLKELEDEFGKQLLIREPRRILLTDDGQLLRRRAEEILSLVKKTTGELLHSEEISGDIRIGAGESIHFALLMETAQKLRQQYPGLRFHIISGDGAATMTRLDRGLIDFAFVYGRLDPAKYHEMTLPVRDRWVLLLRRDDELAQRGCFFNTHIPPKQSAYKLSPHIYFTWIIRKGFAEMQSLLLGSQMNGNVLHNRP